MNRFHGIALGCALLPLVAGTIDFVLWLATEESNFAIAGLVIIAVGLVLLLAGLVLLGFAMWSDLRAKRPTRAPTLLVLAALVLNLPVAHAMYRRGERHYFGHRLRVVNDSSARLTSLELVDSEGRAHPLGAVEPRSEERREFLFDAFGEVTFRARVDGAPRVGVMHVFSARDLGRTLRLNADGGFSED